MPTSRRTAHVALALALVCIDEVTLASLRSAKVNSSMQAKAKAKAKVPL